MPEMEISELSELNYSDRQAWQEFVSSHANASMYHTLDWRTVITESFGHKSRYLMARDSSGALMGVLPIYEINSSLFGHFFISLPFVNYGGIVSVDADATKALAAAGGELAKRLGGTHLEMRQVGLEDAIDDPRWVVRRHKAALVVSLAEDIEAKWAGLSSRLRGKVRKAEKAAAKFTVSGPERLEEFYRVFALNMRDLGTPVHGRKFFRSIFSHIQDARLLLVELEGTPVAGALALRRGDRIELPWICSDYRASRSHVNEYLYWNAIQWAARTGAAHLDLGRSTVDAGTYKFKMQWNPAVVPLHWYYLPVAGTELAAIDPQNPKYAAAIECWKRMPVTLANFVGPALIKNIP